VRQILSASATGNVYLARGTSFRYVLHIRRNTAHFLPVLFRGPITFSESPCSLFCLEFDVCSLRQRPRAKSGRRHSDVVETMRIIVLKIIGQNRPSYSGKREDEVEKKSLNSTALTVSIMDVAPSNTAKERQRQISMAADFSSTKRISRINGIVWSLLDEMLPSLYARFVGRL